MPKTVNRWELTQMKDGIATSLKTATEKLNEMYTDPNTTAEDRATQKTIVQDLTERLEGISLQIDAYDKSVAPKENVITDEKTKVINAKAELIRATMARKPIPQNVRAALKDDAEPTGGANLLPTQLSTELVTEPKAKNPLRTLVKIKTIEGLEMPKISYTISDDDFIADGITAKEMAASAGLIQFGRNKYKVYTDISETVLAGTDTALVADVNSSLEAGMAAKEKKVMFSTSPKSGEELMSFYSTQNAITVIKGANLYAAIRNALADLEDAYSPTIVMKKSDYYSIIDFLSNGSNALYGAQPEAVLGAPVVFCDSAVKPVVGDFSYAVLNYSPKMTFETDKNVKTGMQSFVITAYFDFRILMASAFRIAEVEGV